MNMRRLRSFILAFMPQLGIGLHQCLIAKGVLYLHLGLSRDVYTRHNNNLRDQRAERKSCSKLILGLQHNIENMLTQAEWQSHNDGIQELSPLLNRITPMNSRPEIVLDNLRKQVVQGRKNTDSDICSLLFTLRNSMKELSKILQRGSHQNLIEWAGRNLKQWYTNDSVDGLWINLNHMPLYSRLKDNSIVLILHRFQMRVELSNKPGEHDAGTIEKVAPVI
jgi:hypothetical protein